MYIYVYIFVGVCLYLSKPCSFVHGRLPYNLLKPDPVLRSLLLSLPIWKVVSYFSSFSMNYEMYGCLMGWDCLTNYFFAFFLI